MPTLEITAMIGCPLKCTFCPQDKLRGLYGKNTKYFTLENFQTVISKVPKHVRIDFSGMAEPWANPNATKMLRHVLEQGFNVAIYTTLYGMSAENRAEVISLLQTHVAQVEVLNLHLPDAKGNMLGWRHSQEYEQNLTAFVQFGLSGALRRFEAMTMDSSGEVHPDLQHLGIKLGSFYGHTRAGNVEEQKIGEQAHCATPEHHSAVVCPFARFYDNNVCLPNGDVYLCCMDYGLQHKVGNLLTQGYYEMFASGGLSALQAENMQPRFSKESLCKTCDRATLVKVGDSHLMWT
ncbi:sulfatase maturation enzyme AslB (radical SAM superfamily) [Rhodoblastus acidophilus]|uniref:radical SAM/SPASM domain-containing protein n=1 Tax=Rhodoblastus acidophilus TaxID=1074 RepID=UPI0022251346|nr:SPASM domain-containing protein [Rhodoblastus acidophilus]MCW2284826.1 sulfatase maturation enzyme AslB (radical SAM superfamily) [Rhodoblastus acidophilus]MCW2333884.1 sulfatase maturation enzyme AslB (radical SAM superfamily) [Rhodoblastus acidophilus]